jgi:hypothetical protein
MIIQLLVQNLSKIRFISCTFYNPILVYLSFKGIVSQDLGVFFISVGRYEARNRAGSVLFFISKRFLYLNF